MVRENAQVGHNVSEEELARRTTILRRYAEVNRRVGEMLSRLVDEAQVIWVGDVLSKAFSAELTKFSDTATGHELHLDADEAQKNVYRRAVYLIDEASSYRQELEKIKTAQREVMFLADVKRPYRGMLEPVLVEGVERVKLRPQRGFLDKRLEPNLFIKDLQKRLEQVKANTRQFETVSADDQETKRLYQEVEELERIIERVATTTQKLLVRRAYVRVMANVMANAKAAKEHYIREQGLILCGSDITVGVSDFPRKRRSDRITDEHLKPLFSLDELKVYELEAWEDALASLR